MSVVDPQGLLKPSTQSQLIAPWVARLNSPPKPDLHSEHGPLLTDGSEPMATLLNELDCVAPSLLSVLILGPTGSGKELVAREVHTRSKRRGPFIPVNCAEFSETLMESELFGHTKGAFTGADRDRRGAIEQAEGGTLFLDEVADLSPRLQSLFLRVLQEREIRRVGSERIHKVDVRFLAATHRDLEQLIATGRFRRDLHYRLKGVVLHVPSLHERRHEFPFLVPRLVARIAREAGLECPELSPGLVAALAQSDWPGNIRELRHAIERALLKCKQGSLKVSHFLELTSPASLSLTWATATKTYQRSFLLTELRANDFQITSSAAKLGLTRQSLYATARRLGLDIAREKAEWQTADDLSLHETWLGKP
jgi:DNA-binding NtrC family response regulator